MYVFLYSIIFTQILFLAGCLLLLFFITALTVRFITKRYIGDYMSGDNQTYSYQLSDEKRKQTVVFLDESNEMVRIGLLS